jgi:hypothetical protein
MVMIRNLGQFECFVGVDVSQERLDVCLLPAGERAAFSRDRRGVGASSPGSPVRRACWWWSRLPVAWSGY